MMDTESFQSFALKDELTITQGKGGLPLITIENDFASAVISIYAAQVLSYKLKPVQQGDTPDDLLFMSDQSYFEAGKAIRGGIPICWPWFGKDANNPDKARHGFVRLMLWDLIETTSLNDGSTQVTLSVKDTKASREIWPYRFKLSLNIVVGKTLKLSLESENRDDVPFTMTQALHSYFSVSDITQVRVDGLDKVSYLDKASVAIKEDNIQSGSVTIDNEVDRIYINSPDTLALIDAAIDRKVIIQSTGSQTTIVWNPWADLSKQSAELADSAYQQFICVETANAVDDCVEVLPAMSHKMTVEYSVSG